MPRVLRTVSAGAPTTGASAIASTIRGSSAARPAGWPRQVRRRRAPAPSRIAVRAAATRGPRPAAARGLAEPHGDRGVLRLAGFVPAPAPFDANGRGCHRVAIPGAVRAPPTCCRPRAAIPSACEIRLRSAASPDDGRMRAFGAPGSRPVRQPCSRRDTRAVDNAMAEQDSVGGMTYRLIDTPSESGPRSPVRSRPKPRSTFHGRPPHAERRGIARGPG